MLLSILSFKVSSFLSFLRICIFNLQTFTVMFKTVIEQQSITVKLLILLFVLSLLISVQAFLGNRYGYQPLPPSISQEHFESMLQVAKSKSIDTTVLCQWYKLDTNIMPPLYQLQPITDFYPYYSDYSNVLQKSHQQQWHQTYNLLFETISTLTTIAVNLSLMTEYEAHQYVMSSKLFHFCNNHDLQIVKFLLHI